MSDACRLFIYCKCQLVWFRSNRGSRLIWMAKFLMINQRRSPTHEQQAIRLCGLSMLLCPLMLCSWFNLTDDVLDWYIQVCFCTRHLVWVFLKANCMNFIHATSTVSGVSTVHRPASLCVLNLWLNPTSYIHLWEVDTAEMKWTLKKLEFMCFCVCVNIPHL